VVLVAPVVALLAPAVVSASPREGWESSLVVNRGAESGNLEGWEGSGFEVDQYGAGGVLPPLSVAEAHSLGSDLFVASAASAEMSQTVSLPSGPEITVGGFLGGAEAGDMRESVVFLNSAGTPAGAPIVLGPPSAASREGASTLFECNVGVPVPSEARSAKVILAADGVPAFADEIYVSNVAIATSEVEVVSSNGKERVSRESAGPYCVRERLVPFPSGSELPPSPFNDPPAPLPAPQGRGGLIEGTVYKAHSPASGWHVVIGALHRSLAHEAIRIFSTHAHGRFSVTISPGTYEIAAEAPHGHPCAEQKVTVVTDKTTRLKLRCR
jgi:hypothetical protein